ncbi:MAG: signal peptide peptidase SppA [Tannerellaceae bacterium]|nr:signal peptide peptidase SppA [Tannerellaceae bacterium]
MKQFFKMMFASAFGVLLASGIMLIISFVVLIGFISSLSSSSEYNPKPNTVFKLTLEGTIADNAEENPLSILLGEKNYTLSLRDILAAIEAAKYNPHIQGIYLEGGFLSTGTSNIDAIRRAIIDFKESGKFVIAYADYYTQGAYYLCSVADEIYMNPSGTLALAGLSSQTTFYKGLLNKIGVEMLVFKVGTFKGAVEPFMLNKLSEENRLQIMSYQQSIWGNVTAGISQARNIPVEEINRFADEGYMIADPEKAVTFRLVDELRYKSEVEEYVKGRAGQRDKKLLTAGMDKMKYIRQQTNRSREQIAVLYAEGEIMPEEMTSIYGNSQIISERVANELIKLKNDENVKAVVFRVNSPGGSAFIAEQIWHQVQEIKKVKPIVVSMGNTAASGGYYISCAADIIVAEPNTLTGSIGVFGLLPNATGLYDKLDLTTDVVKTNKYADIRDLSRPMREDEKALIQASIERTYDLFLTRCSEGRNMSKEQIDEIGQGRVWTGEQALAIGLVDELGGMETAISTAAVLANLDDYKVTHISGSTDFFKDLWEKQLTEIKMSAVKEVLGNEYEHYQTVKSIQSNIGVLARLPYEISSL